VAVLARVAAVLVRVAAVFARVAAVLARVAAAPRAAPGFCAPPPRAWSCACMSRALVLRLTLRLTLRSTLPPPFQLPSPQQSSSSAIA
jgi:hypothetical protein